MRKAAEWMGTPHYPHPFLSADWKSVDVENFKVTADDALLIADANGGRGARLAIQNHCKVLVGIPNIDNENWKVEFYSGSTTIFSMFINPLTGKYEIINPSK
jgi:hypothetical protein